MARMHAGEADIDAALVRRLVADQFPQWAGRRVAAVVPGGTDNAIYRLGHDLAVRLPRIEKAAGQVDKEQRWLPLLAPFLPLPVPTPVALGTPAAGYPWRWSVYRWLKGRTAATDRPADLGEAAAALARFLTALHGIDPTGGPPPDEHNFFRGVPLAARDRATRAAIADLGDELDGGTATRAWEMALQAPSWPGPAVWIHGDMGAANLIVDRGRLSAVIDFGGLAVGDPACDLLVAWDLFPADVRPVFRSALGIDDAAWARGRGWALSVGLIALPYYQRSNPALAARARKMIDRVLATRR